MNNLIYQYWEGIETDSIRISVSKMKNYADKIGSDYIYEHNPGFYKKFNLKSMQDSYAKGFGILKLIYMNFFNEYDYVMFADCDVFPVDNLKENIFEQFYDTDYQAGFCIEEGRTSCNWNINKNNNKWASILENNWDIKVLRAENQYPEMLNSGICIFSSDGLKFANKTFIEIKEYLNLIKELPEFWKSDQPYINAMLYKSKLNFKIIDYKWNSIVDDFEFPIIRDTRKNSNFIHLQLKNKLQLNLNQIQQWTKL
jgi:hypothetical protein